MVIFLGTLFLVICVLLIVVVLLQKGRGGGLGAAFGGVGTSAFGTRTGDVFTWVTIVLTGLFLLMAVVTTLVLRPERAPAASVQFTPAETVIPGPVGVTMFCQTPQAEIHYTTDGSPVTQLSPIYQKTPVEVRPGITLRAKAYARGYKEGPEIVAVYRSTAEAAETAAPATAPASAPMEAEP